MSNKIVPQIYRNIIDDVIRSVAVDFEEYGMDEGILQDLQAKWEAKLLETRVADFARAPGASTNATGSTASPPPQASSPAGSVPSNYSYSNSGQAGPSGYQQQGLALPGLSRGHQYTGEALPSLGTNGLLNVKAEPDDVLRMRGGASDIDDKEKVNKADVKPEPNAAGLLPGDEVIDSDLDDSDDELRDEDEEGGDGWEGDIVFCVWDKVQRVKNKWKTTFKDGMIHINGKDYLFTKCTGEFEW